eukprot:8641836-Pyramimonas_sp.AAC.1
MRTPPLEPSVELPMGQRSAALGGGNSCGQCLWGVLRCSFLWGDETLHWFGKRMRALGPSVELPM